MNELRPFLVSVDISLPGENGLDLTRKIKNGHPEMQVVILTSHDVPEYRDAARRCGANHFMVKGSASFQEILGVAHSILSKGGWWKSYEPEGWQCPPCFCENIDTNHK